MGQAIIDDDRAIIDHDRAIIDIGRSQCRYRAVLR